MSRITGALGKGIATLTLDDEYQKKRREQLNKRPEDLKEGLARGGKGLVMVSVHSTILQYCRFACIYLLHELSSCDRCISWCTSILCSGCI